MRKINYKSDFDFLMRLKDSAGKDVPFPECDWDAVFWTSSKAKAYHASCIGGVCTNCRKEPDGISFIFDSHNMGLGTVHWEPHFRLPNGLYPDGYQDLFRKRALGIELVDGDGDCPTTAEIELVAPFIKGDTGATGPQGPQGPKGDAFTYADFTPEQIAELQKPATDAIAAVEATEKAVRDAESLRVSAEKVREARAAVTVLTLDFGEDSTQAVFWNLTGAKKITAVQTANVTSATIGTETLAAGVTIPDGSRQVIDIVKQSDGEPSSIGLQLTYA